MMLNIRDGFNAVSRSRSCGFRTGRRISALLLLQSPEHSSAVQEEKDSKTRKQSVKTHTSISGVALGTPTASLRRKPAPVSPARSITPEVIQVGSLKHSLHLVNPHFPRANDNNRSLCVYTLCQI